MNKTIIYSGEFVLPDRSAAANRVVANSKAFAELGYKTVFLGSSGSNNSFCGVREVSGFKDMFEASHPSSSLQWIKHIFSVKNLKSFARKYNAGTVILYNTPVLTLICVRLAFIFSGIKVYYDCTEWTKFTEGSYLKRLFKYIDEWFVRNTLPFFCDGIIAISDIMVKKYRRCRKLIMIPPLVDITDTVWNQKPFDDDDIFEFCFAGIPDGNKESPDKILEAFSLISDDKIRLRIVGITKNDYITNYPDSASLAGDRRIVFEGRVPHKDAVQFIINCDCYIFIRVSDSRNNAGFPTKFAEAYTLCRPVITTAISDLPSYFENNECGELLDGISVEKISAAMKRQLEKGKISKDGRLSDRFDYHSYLEEFKSFIN